MSRKKATLASSAIPFLAFMLAGWYGIAAVVQSKRDLRTATKGLEPVEEMDPLERMRRRYGLGAEQQQKEAVPVSSLEEELSRMQETINIKDFDYKPVPRQEDE